MGKYYEDEELEEMVEWFQDVEQPLHKALKFILTMAELYIENRSDVTEACMAFLENQKMPTEDNVEHRMIYAKLPKTAGVWDKDLFLFYDTLTTMFAVGDTIDGEWYNPEFVEGGWHAYGEDDFEEHYKNK